MKRHPHIYLAPSGIQKERILPEDLFVIDATTKKTVKEPSPVKKLKKSECTPLFLLAYDMRDAGAVIHSHGVAANLVTLLYDKEFRITHQEMIKGIKKGSTTENFRYDDVLTVPIIENTPFESELSESLAAAIEKYPNTNAVLVRRHGVYVWGKSWQSAKTMCECYHYLFDLAVQMKKLNLDPEAVP